METGDVFHPTCPIILFLFCTCQEAYKRNQAMPPGLLQLYLLYSLNKVTEASAMAFTSGRILRAICFAGLDSCIQPRAQGRRYNGYLQIRIQERRYKQIFYPPTIYVLTKKHHHKLRQHRVKKLVKYFINKTRHFV